eukprot:COSAG05_NODE_959_length_6425_cov_4.388397_2_plen_78_part_00
MSGCQEMERITEGDAELKKHVASIAAAEAPDDVALTPAAEAAVAAATQFSSRMMAFQENMESTVASLREQKQVSSLL